MDDLDNLRERIGQAEAEIPKDELRLDIEARIRAFNKLLGKGYDKQILASIENLQRQLTELDK